MPVFEWLVEVLTYGYTDYHRISRNWVSQTSALLYPNLNNLNDRNGIYADMHVRPGFYSDSFQASSGRITHPWIRLKYTLRIFCHAHGWAYVLFKTLVSLFLCFYIVEKSRLPQFTGFVFLLRCCFQMSAKQKVRWTVTGITFKLRNSKR